MNRVVKLNKPKSHRKAIFMNLANALLKHERITTTVTRAMELRRVADRLVSLAKRKDLHSQRLAFAFLRDKEIVNKLFTDIGDRYTTINGGYTRVLKVGNRKGDNAPMAIIELTQRKEQDKKEKAKEAKKEAAEKKEAKAKKEAKPKKEAREKKEPKAKAATKAKKEPKAKKEAKSADAEAKEKKPRKKKEEAKEEVVE